MTHWIRTLVLAFVFAAVGAFATSIWLEVRRDRVLVLDSPSSHWHDRRIRVEVLNAAGVDALARRATGRLRELGFDVVYYGNADQFDVDSSVAIARLDSIEPARRVADALGVQRVEREPDENLYLDVSVILGKDWSVPVEEESEIGQLEIWWSRIKRAARRFWPE